MSDTFSKRYGYGKGTKELIYEKAPQQLRIGLWNLIQDYVSANNLAYYDELYLKLTSFFRLKREDNINYKNEIESWVLNAFDWNKIFDLIEYLYKLVVYYDYDEEKGSWRVFPEYVREIRYNYTIKINDLLSSENIGWRLKKGELEREGSEYLDRETIERVKKVLKHSDFEGPNNQFLKAIDFFNKRPKPDLENCVKEAVGALEGVARILLKDRNITLGKATDKLVKRNKIRKPFDKIFHVLYGFVSNEPGSRHGAFKLSEIDLGETELVLYNSAACMLFLCEKFGYKPIEETKEDLTEDEVPF